MHVLVCLKHVPETTTVVRVSADGRELDPAGVKWIVSPFDEYALDHAVRLRDGGEAESVTALCLGPPAARTSLRQALAVGADRGVLLESETLAGRDARVRSRALALAIREERADLVLAGKLGAGTDEGETGPRLSVLLDRPHAGQVVDFAITDGRFSARRAVEGGFEIVEGTLPAVLSCDRGPREPRYPSLKGIMQAKKKPLDTIAPQELGIDPDAPEWTSRVEVLSLELPPGRSGCRFFEGPPARAARELVAVLRDEAKAL